MTKIKKISKKAVFAAWISSTAFYYDFFIYNLGFSYIFSKYFFSNIKEYFTIISLMTLILVYVGRPLGSLIFGFIADIYGRRTVTFLLLILIGCTTLFIGFLPLDKETSLVGLYSLLIIRFFQGVFLGAEKAVIGTLVFEYSPDNRRGFCTSFASSGAVVGTLLASLVFVLIMKLPEDAILEWGWRIAFYFSTFVVVIGIVIRLMLDETPVFNNEYHKIARFPLFNLFRYEWANLIRIIFIGLIAMIRPLLSIFLINYGVIKLGLPLNKAVIIITISSLISIFIIPLWGLLSDTIGRKPVFLIGSLGVCFLIWPFIWSINEGNIPLIFVFSIFLSSIFFNAANGVATTLYAEMFSEKVRVIGIALGTQVAYIFSYTLTGVIQILILKNSWFVCAIIISFIMITVSVVMFFSKETAFTPMKELGRKNMQNEIDIFK